MYDQIKCNRKLNFPFIFGPSPYTSQPNHHLFENERKDLNYFIFMIFHIIWCKCWFCFPLKGCKGEKFQICRIYDRCLYFYAYFPLPSSTNISLAGIFYYTQLLFDVELLKRTF